jgi:hypothetical protein
VNAGRFVWRRKILLPAFLNGMMDIYAVSRRSKMFRIMITIENDDGLLHKFGYEITKDENKKSILQAGQTMKYGLSKHLDEYVAEKFK